ncbi:MAG: ABC transporter permease [Proteobacteria bacterium]|nr:ABC transporter permease [Pseudomonadota bacterium]
MTRSLPRPILSLLLPVALVALWQASGQVFGGVRMPLPSRVVGEAVMLVTSGALPSAMVQSLGRVFAGFVLAIAVAVPLGLLMGTMRGIERNLDPLVESFRPVAAIALLPMAILWFGTGTPAAVMLVAYAAFFPILINTISGAKQVDPHLVLAAATMGVRPATILRTVIVPGAMPQIAVGLRIGLGVAWTAIVAAELAVGAKSGGGGSGGIGQMMFVFYAYSIELNRIIVCMIGVGFVSLFLDWLVRTGSARLMPWRSR